MSEIPEVQGPQSPLPPPRTEAAVTHQGLSSAWGVNGFTHIAANQTGAIRWCIYYLEVMNQLQGVLGQLNTAMLDLRNDPSKASFDKLMKVFGELKKLKGMTAAQWGGKFGAKVGEGIYKAVQGMYKDIYNSLGTVTGIKPASVWQIALKHGGVISPINPPGLAKLMWESIGTQVKAGLDPFSGVQKTVGTQISSFNDLNAMQQAQMKNLQNHMGLALQGASKFMNKMWQVLLQMIANAQQG